MDASEASLVPCPRCRYPLPERSARCPECAYEPTREDWDFKERRVLFLELTQFSSRLVIASCFVVTAFVSVWALLLEVPWAASLFLVARQSPQLHRRLAQRVWAFSLPWLLFPWLVLIGAMRWASGNWWIRPPWGWTMSRWLSLSDPGLGGMFVPLLIGGCAVFTYLGWRSQWQRLARLAGLPKDLAQSPASVVSLRLTLMPLFVIAVGMFILIGVPQLLDLLHPGWQSAF